MRIIIPSIQFFISACIGFYLVQHANINWEAIKDGLLFFSLLSIFLYMFYHGIFSILRYISNFFVDSHLIGYGSSPVLSIGYIFILILLKPIIIDTSDIIYLIVSFFLILLTDIVMKPLKNQTSKNSVVKRSLVAILYLPTSTLLMVIILVMLKPYLK